MHMSSLLVPAILEDLFSFLSAIRVLGVLLGIWSMSAIKLARPHSASNIVPSAYLACFYV
jgi:hypothetical protein